jgi:tRNA (adenine57-N1/adenine58-N1)-methyltransferase
VLLREKKDAHDGRLVTLRASKTTQTHRGVVKHADVIGKEPRQVVQSNKGATYRVVEPTLAEYVRLTPRLVTPVRSLHARCDTSRPVEVTAVDLPV